MEQDDHVRARAACSTPGSGLMDGCAGYMTAPDGRELLLQAMLSEFSPPGAARRTQPTGAPRSCIGSTGASNWPRSSPRPGCPAYILAREASSRRRHARPVRAVGLGPRGSGHRQERLPGAPVRRRRFPPGPGHPLAGDDVRVRARYGPTSARTARMRTGPRQGWLRPLLLRCTTLQAALGHQRSAAPALRDGDIPTPCAVTAASTPPDGAAPAAPPRRHRRSRRSAELAA